MLSLLGLLLMNLLSFECSHIDVIGYYGNSGNAVSAIPKFSEIDSNYNVVIITFANFNNHGQLDFLIQGPYEKNLPLMGSDILAWKKKADVYGRRKSVLVSIGGQNGNWPPSLSSSQIESALTAFMGKYNLDGFDIDLESSAVSGAASLAPVIQSFTSKGKIVTAAPEAAQSSLKAYQGIISKLTWVHPQFYNNQPNAVADPYLPPASLWPKPWTVTDWQDEKQSVSFWGGVLAAIGTATGAKQTQLGMLIPASPSAAGSANHWNIDKLKKEVMWAKISHVGCWAIAYDHQIGYKFAKAMGSINQQINATNGY